MDNSIVRSKMDESTLDAIYDKSVKDRNNKIIAHLRWAIKHCLRSELADSTVCSYTREYFDSILLSFDGYVDVDLCKQENLLEILDGCKVVLLMRGQNSNIAPIIRRVEESIEEELQLREEELKLRAEIPAETKEEEITTYNYSLEETVNRSHRFTFTTKDLITILNKTVPESIPEQTPIVVSNKTPGVTHIMCSKNIEFSISWEETTRK